MRALTAAALICFFSHGWTMEPAEIPLPEQPNESQPPQIGYKGVWTDGIGDTHVQYGSNPISGMPEHNKHLRYNYRKHPENDAPFPRLDASPQVNIDLRTDMIGNKPKYENQHRDHKPPNVQKIYEERGPINDPRYHPLSNSERKQRNTVMSVSKEESHQEMRLLKQASTNSRRPGNTGYIHLHASNERSNRPGSGGDSNSDGSTGSSLGSSLKSDPEQQKKEAARARAKAKARAQGSMLPLPSPRRTRSQTRLAAAAAAAAAGDQASGSKLADIPGTPPSRISRPIAKTPAPKTPFKSRIPVPIHGTMGSSESRPQTPESQPQSLGSRPPTPETPSKSRIPVPVPQTPDSPTLSAVTSKLGKLKFKRDLLELEVRKRELIIRRDTARIAAVLLRSVL